MWMDVQASFCIRKFTNDQYCYDEIKKQHELPFEVFIGLVNEGCILIGRGILKLIIYNYCMYILDLSEFQLEILYELFHSLTLCFLSPNFLCFFCFRYLSSGWIARSRKLHHTRIWIDLTSWRTFTLLIWTLMFLFYKL